MPFHTYAACYYSYSSCVRSVLCIANGHNIRMHGREARRFRPNVILHKQPKEILCVSLNKQPSKWSAFPQSLVYGIYDYDFCFMKNATSFCFHSNGHALAMRRIGSSACFTAHMSDDTPAKTRRRLQHKTKEIEMYFREVCSFATATAASDCAHRSRTMCNARLYTSSQTKTNGTSGKKKEMCSAQFSWCLKLLGNTQAYERFVCLAASDWATAQRSKTKGYHVEHILYMK